MAIKTRWGWCRCRQAFSLFIHSFLLLKHRYFNSERPNEDFYLSAIKNWEVSVSRSFQINGHRKWPIAADMQIRCQICCSDHANANLSKRSNCCQRQLFICLLTAVVVLVDTHTDRQTDKAQRVNLTLLDNCCCCREQQIGHHTPKAVWPKVDTQT